MRVSRAFTISWSTASTTCRYNRYDQRCKLSFTGTALPALTEFSVGRLLIGLKNPLKSYRTLTLKLPVAWLPAWSVAEQLMVVGPMGKMLLEAGEQLTSGRR